MLFYDGMSKFISSYWGAKYMVTIKNTAQQWSTYRTKQVNFLCINQILFSQLLQDRATIPWGGLTCTYRYSTTTHRQVNTYTLRKLCNHFLAMSSHLPNNEGDKLGASLCTVAKRHVLEIVLLRMSPWPMLCVTAPSRSRRMASSKANAATRKKNSFTFSPDKHTASKQ